MVSDARAKRLAQMYPLDAQVFGERNPHRTTMTLAAAAGFASVAWYAFGLVLDPRLPLDPASQLGPLVARPGVRIVLFNHPARPWCPEVDDAAIMRQMAGHWVFGGESYGGQVAARVCSRYIERTGDEDVGLVLVSAFHDISDLFDADGVRKANRLHIPNWAGRPVMQVMGRLFARDWRLAERLAHEGHPEWLPTAVKSLKRSHWVPEVSRAIERQRGFGIRGPARGRVVVGNVENDGSVNTMTALAKIARLYPGITPFTIAGADGHGSGSIRPGPYQVFWNRDVYGHFASIWPDLPA